MTGDPATTSSDKGEWAGRRERSEGFRDRSTEADVGRSSAGLLHRGAEFCTSITRATARCLEQPLKRAALVASKRRTVTATSTPDPPLANCRPPSRLRSGQGPSTARARLRSSWPCGGPSAAPALAAAPDHGDLAPFPFPCRAVVGQRDAPHGAPQGRQHTCSRQEGDRRGDRRHRERIAV